MQRYAVADLLTSEQIARALAATYLPTPKGPRTAEGGCPMAVAIGRPTLVPDPVFVAMELCPQARGADLDAVRELVMDLMFDWDHGALAIEHLAAALGVSKIGG
jgi:hypothetical protein